MAVVDLEIEEVKMEVFDLVVWDQRVVKIVVVVGEILDLEVSGWIVVKILVAVVEV